MAPLSPDRHNSVVARPPAHPVPQLQGPFEESLDEAMNDSLDEQSELDSVARRTKLLESENYERVCAGRWKQRPGEKFHPLWKISAQMSFGMHLLAQGLAKSDDEVMQILQTHVDDIDGFLERTTEDFDLAQSDVQERLRYLKLPLEHGQVFDHMLEDWTFRASIVGGNAKIKHIVARTSKAVKDALKDVQKGLDATSALGRYLADLGESWTEKLPEHEAVLVAMAGNVEGWGRVFMDLHLQGNKLSHSLAQLETVVAEVERRVGVASRKAVFSSSSRQNAESQRKRSKPKLQLQRSASHLFQSPNSRAATPLAQNKPLPIAPDLLSSARQTGGDIKIRERYRRQYSSDMLDDGLNSHLKLEIQPARRKAVADERVVLTSAISTPDLIGRWNSTKKRDERVISPFTGSPISPSSLRITSHQTTSTHESPKLHVTKKRSSIGRMIDVVEKAPVELPADVPQSFKVQSSLPKQDVFKPSIASKIKENPDYLSSSNPLSSQAITGLLKSSSSSLSTLPSTSQEIQGLQNTGYHNTQHHGDVIKKPEMIDSPAIMRQRPFVTAPSWMDSSDSDDSIRSLSLERTSPPSRNLSKGAGRRSSSNGDFGNFDDADGDLTLYSAPLTSRAVRTSSPTDQSRSGVHEPKTWKIPLQPHALQTVSYLQIRKSWYQSSAGEPESTPVTIEDSKFSDLPDHISELECFTPTSPVAREYTASAPAPAPEIVPRPDTPEAGLTMATMRSASDFLKLPPRQTTSPADGASLGVGISHAGRESLVAPVSGRRRTRRSTDAAKLSIPRLAITDARAEAMPKTMRRYSDFIDFLASTPSQSPIHARSPSSASSRSGSDSIRASLTLASASRILAPPDEAPPPPAPGGRSMVSPDFAAAGAFEGERKLRVGSGSGPGSSSSGWKKMFSGVSADGKHGESGRGGGAETMGVRSQDPWFKGMGVDGVWVSGN